MSRPRCSVQSNDTKSFFSHLIYVYCNFDLFYHGSDVHVCPKWNLFIDYDFKVHFFEMYSSETRWDLHFLDKFLCWNALRLIFQSTISLLFPPTIQTTFIQSALNFRRLRFKPYSSSMTFDLWVAIHSSLPDVWDEAQSQSVKVLEMWINWIGICIKICRFKCCTNHRF